MTAPPQEATGGPPAAVTGQDGVRRGRRRGGGGGERPMVPPAHFTSYYGRPVVKASPWESDIPAYLFLGGVAAGSSLLSAGADLTGRPAMRRTGRVGALVAITLSLVALVRDLGRPSRFHHMLRVVKPTSPMSVGTWVLTTYGPFVGLAAAAELRPLLPRPVRDGWLGRLLSRSARPAGLLAAAAAPAVASYTAVLLTDTCTPSWSAAQRELPFVFAGSAAAAGAGLALVGAPVAEGGPARRLAVVGAVLELAVERQMETSMGITAEPLHDGQPGRLMTLSKALTVGGAVGAATLARRSRLGAVASGLALLGGSAALRFAVFEAGQHSARDPKYTVVPQRERLDRGQGAAR